MKTAMQDMIYFLTKAIDMCHDDFEQKINISWIKFHAELLLEIEKEQLEKCWDAAFDEGIGDSLGQSDYDQKFINYFNKIYKHKNK